MYSFTTDTDTRQWLNTRLPMPQITWEHGGNTTSAFFLSLLTESGILVQKSSHTHVSLLTHLLGCLQYTIPSVLLCFEAVSLCNPHCNQTQPPNFQEYRSTPAYWVSLKFWSSFLKVETLNHVWRSLNAEFSQGFWTFFISMLRVTSPPSVRELFTGCLCGPFPRISA